MLHKVVQPRTGEYDYLIVELKRPTKKIDSEVLSQIESYAMAVANDERFHGIKQRGHSLPSPVSLTNLLNEKLTNAIGREGKFMTMRG